MYMKRPFDFGRKSRRRSRYRDFPEEYIDEEYVEEDYPEEGYEDYPTEEYTEYPTEEYVEYPDEEYIEYPTEEYVEYSAEEYTEYPTEEYVEYPDEEYTEYPTEEYVEYPAEEYVEEYAEEEITYEEDVPVILPLEQDVFYEEDLYEDNDGEESAGLLSFGDVSGLVDKLITFGGVAVLLVGIFIGGIFLYSHMNTADEDGFLNVGNQLAQIDVIGESGLLAVSDAQKAALEAAEMAEEEEEEQEPEEYEEEEYNTEVTVKLSIASIEKDLKIKFVNQETGKLVGNVPFSIQVTDPGGKVKLWSDDDMDGIIYKKNLEAGKYKISVNAFEDKKYKKYGLPPGTQKVDVKAEIEYKKVDVANEVKTESQVDVQKEDTKIKETVVESYLTDTVTWVESTATLVAYTEVAKSNIVDPMQLVMNSSFVRLSTSGGDVITPTPTPEPTPTPTPEVSPSPSPTPEVSPSPSPSPSPTPTPKPMVITLDQKTATVYMEEPVVLTVVKVENEMKDAVITASSSDTGVATVAVEGKQITVTGVAAGQATITVNCTAEVKETVKDGDSTAEKTVTYKASPVTCTVVVKANPKQDTTTVLKDNQGREVFVLDNNTYRTAHYADYYTYSKFYVKGEAKYTGWQTINGNRYFYDGAGKKVIGEQVIQGVKYNFASDGSLVTGSGTLGIDVSKWNGNIDWTAVKNSGVSYVIIRCGYRGSSEGALIKDSKFEANIKGAINAGLKVGVYFFSQAVDKNEAVEEASMVLESVKNYKISYPIFLDVEPSGGRADSISVETRTEVCKAFCETIQSYGYTAGIYANKTWFTEKINTGELSGKYKIWLAQYAAEPTYTGRYDMWQYKATGKINGISGDVDMNLSYLGY